jgi:hypothetical protein
MISKKRFLSFSLSLSLIFFAFLPAKAQWTAAVSGNFQLASIDSEQGNANRNRFTLRTDFSRRVLPWFFLGGFGEWLHLGSDLNSNQGGGPRTSFGGLAAYQERHILIQILLAWSSESGDSGIMAALEGGYFFPINQNLFIGPKLTAKRYSLDSKSERTIEPGIHLIYWF